jgi:hypothetical protein
MQVVHEAIKYVIADNQAADRSEELFLTLLLKFNSCAVYSEATSALIAVMFQWKFTKSMKVKV